MFLFNVGVSAGVIGAFIPAKCVTTRDGVSLLVSPSKRTYSSPSWVNGFKVVPEQSPCQTGQMMRYDLRAPCALTPQIKVMS